MGRAGASVFACLALLGACRGPTSCAGRPQPGPPPTSASPSTIGPAEPPTLVDRLFVPPSSYDFSRNPALLERIMANAHGYLRFVNISFAEAVCREFADEVGNVPPVNLHGDAHVEQYAVTDLGRGLTDFDDSSKGPAILDLLRFGVSLHLAARLAGPALEPGRLFGHFLDAYRAALDDPDFDAEEPGWVEEVKAGFTADRAQYFDWIRSIMSETDSDFEEVLVDGLEAYVEAMLEKHPKLPPSFFDVVEVGRLRMGIGSALDRKYLVRVAGLTEHPLDDVVLEVKEVRSLAGISCIEGSGSSDPFRILLAQKRIAYNPYGYLGYIDLEGQKFWIHSWVDNYRELDVETLVERPEILEEIVYDVGVQLGRGHPKIAGEFERQLRRSQIDFLDRHRQAIGAAVARFADATEAAWRRFRAEEAERGSVE